MGLQSSGQITLQDIATELGVGSSNLSLASMSDTAGFSEPDAMTDFYGYVFASYTNTHYMDFSRNALRRSATTSPFSLSGSQDLSVSVWVRQKPTTANEIMWDFSTTSSNSANRFFLQYHRSLNRLVARHRTSGVNYDRQWPLHDNNSATGTGTNSGVAWSDTNRGNVDSDNFCLLTVTYDASQSNSSNGLKLYWNTSELTSQASNNSGTRSTSAVNDFTIGNNNHNATTTAGGMNAQMDELKIYGSVLSAANVAAIYNAGVVDSANSYSTGLITEYTFSSNTEDSNGLFPTSQVDTGTRTAY